MTVGELRTMLATVSDDRLVLVTKTSYNGWTGRTTTENAILVSDGESIVVTDESTMDELYCIKL